MRTSEVHPFGELLSFISAPQNRTAMLINPKHLKASEPKSWSPFGRYDNSGYQYLRSSSPTAPDSPPPTTDAHPQS